MAERSISVKLQAEVGSYVQGIGRARAATGDLITELSKSEQARQNFQRLGTGMLVAGAGIAAGIGLATKAAVDWETAWAGVVKTVDGTDAQLAMLEEELREMARTLPATHTEIAAVAEAAGQLGVATEDVSDFTRTMIDLGVATNLTAEEAAVSLAQFMNVMGTSSDEVDNLGAAIVDLGNNSATTEADIVAMAQRIGGAGATIGLTEADVLGFAAALASVGIRAEAGGSAISRAMIEIEGAVRDGGGALETLARVAGMSADQFAQAYEQDAARAIATFVGGLGRMQESGEDVFAVLDELGFSEIRLRDALLRLSEAGDQLTNSLDRGETAWEEQLALVQEAETRYGSTAAQLQIAKNNLNDLAITLGETFLPVLGEVADKLGSFAEFLGELPTPVLQVVGVTAALTAGVLLLGGTAITAVTKIASYKAALASLETQGGLTATSTGRINRGIRGSVVWAGRAVTALAALQLAAAGVEAAFGQDLNPQIDAMQVGLERFAEEGKVSGEVARVLGEDLEDLALAFRLLGPEGIGPSVGNAIKGFLTPGEWAGAEGSLKHAREEIQALDASMASLVESGNTEVAAEVFRRLTVIAEENGVSVERLMELFPQYAAAIEVAAEGSGHAGNEIAGMGDEAQTAAEKVEELKAAFDELFGIQMDIDRATIAYEQGLHDLMETLDDTNNSLKVQTEDGRENRGAILDQIEAIKELRDANIDAGMSVEDANELYEQQLQELEDLLIQMGFNREQIRDLIGDYKDIPEKADTSVEQPGMERAKKDAERLRRHYRDLPKRVDTRVHTSYTSSGRPPALPPGSGRTQPGFQQRHGGITLPMAEGGVLRRASIFSPMAPARFAFAEPETGGEAFIPKRGDRERSLGILSTAAGWHGATVVPNEQAKPGYVLAEDGSWVPRSFYDTTSIDRVTLPKPGFIQAEDGSWVPKSFYDTPTGQSAAAAEPEVGGESYGREEFTDREWQALMSGGVDAYVALKRSQFAGDRRYDEDFFDTERQRVEGFLQSLASGTMGGDGVVSLGGPFQWRGTRPAQSAQADPVASALADLRGDDDGDTVNVFLDGQVVAGAVKQVVRTGIRTDPSFRSDIRGRS